MRVYGTSIAKILAIPLRAVHAAAHADNPYKTQLRAVAWRRGYEAGYAAALRAKEPK